MATVLLGEDELLGRQVALKRITAQGDARGLSRLRREALIGASVSHPNLVSIYDIVTTEDGDHVIVMEYVPGETVAAALARQGRFTESEALRVLAGVSRALDAIHCQRIVHRDVKPANILLGRGGVVKLADLGIASVSNYTRITTSGAIVGSFSYMAPEQLEGRPATPATDIYALSAVAYELLAGCKARPEANPVALAHALATQSPPDLRDVWPGASPEAAAVLSNGMARDPGLRPRSAGDLVGSLRQTLKPVGPIAVAAPPRRRPAPVPPPGRNLPVPPARARTTALSPRPTPTALPARRPESAPASATGRRSRAAVFAALLALAASAAAVVAIVGSGGSHPAGQRLANGSSTNSRTTASTAPRSTAPRVQRSHQPRHSTHPAHQLQASSISKPPSAASTGPPGNSTSSGVSASAESASGASSLSTSQSPPSSGTSSGASSTPASSGASSAASPPPASSGTSSEASLTPAPGDPVSAVESFYGHAAAHEDGQAWALADPTFRSQLEGYDSFQAQQAGDRQIIFDAARVVSETGDNATVAVSTTSVRDTGTTHCAGTVDLDRGGSAGGWLLHLIHINCS